MTEPTTASPPGAAPASPGRWDRLATRVFLAVAAVNLAVLAPRLVYPDLPLSYPFPGGDSQDWLCNARYLQGCDVPYSVRPPLLPALLALLGRAGLEPWFPLLSLLLLHLTAFALLALLRRSVPPGVALVTALAVLLNHSHQGLALEVMADVPAACLLFLALALLIAAERRPRLAVPAGLLAGASALTQQTALLLPLAVLPALLRRGRRPDAGRWLGAGAVAFAVGPAAWFIAKAVVFGTPGDAGIAQWALLRFHLGSVAYYAFAAVSLLGLPGVLLAGAGLVRALRRGGRDTAGLMAAGLLVTILAFFVLLYTFADKRFLVYALWPAAILAARALAAIPRRGWRAAAAAALLLWSVFPLPDWGGAPPHALLLPVPPLLARADTPGPGKAAITAIGLERMSAREVARASVIGRVLAARAASRPVPTLAPDAVAGDLTAVVLDLPGGGLDRYQVPRRLSNALLKRVRLVPSWLLEPHWRLLRPRVIGRIDTFVVLRVEPEGMGRTSVLIVPEGHPALPVMLATAPAPAPGDTAALALARAVAAAIPDLRRAIVVGVVAPRNAVDPSLAFLPFLLSTQNLYVIDRNAAESVRHVWEGAREIGRSVIGTVEVRRLELARGPGALVLY